MANSLYVVMTRTIEEKMELYQKMIQTNQGVPYIFGEPGTAKTAIMGVICDRNGWYLEDQRLSQKDSSEIGGIPRAVFDEELGLEVMKNIVPDYLAKSVKRKEPTLIVYDELPRAHVDTRNAAMQIFNERRCGDLMLPDRVHIVALGNIGIEDGCEGDEFDNAMLGRLINIQHTLTIDEWVKGFAEKNVNPYIIDFIKDNPSLFYKLPNENERSYPSPRTWTFLSYAIKKNTNPRDFLSFVEQTGACYVGSCIKRFIDWCRDKMKLNIQDIMDNYPKIKKDVEREIKKDRSKEAMLMSELKDEKMKFWKLTKKQRENVAEFLEIITEDARAAFLIQLMEQTNEEDIKGEKEKFLQKFEGDLTSVYKILEKKIKDNEKK